jgi:hypothetical protein
MKESTKNQLVRKVILLTFENQGYIPKLILFIFTPMSTWGDTQVDNQ